MSLSSFYSIPFLQCTEQKNLIIELEKIFEENQTFDKSTMFSWDQLQQSLKTILENAKHLLVSSNIQAFLEEMISTIDTVIAVNIIKDAGFCIR